MRALASQACLAEAGYQLPHEYFDDVRIAVQKAARGYVGIPTFFLEEFDPGSD